MKKLVVLFLAMITFANGQDLSTALLAGLLGPPSGSLTQNGNRQNIDGQAQIVNESGATDGRVAPTSQTANGVSPGTYLWGRWGQYGRCSVTCGSGVRSRQRVCYLYQRRTSSDGGMLDNALPLMLASGGSPGGLSGLLTLSLATGGGLGSLLGRTTNGQQTQGRATIVGQTSREVRCPGPRISTTNCIRRACLGTTAAPRICLTPWGEYGQCSTTCGQGVRLRGRRCICTNPQTGQQTCTESLTQTQPCANLPPCAPVTLPPTTPVTTPIVVGGRWSKWDAWSGCNAPCGVTAIESRTRFCIGTSTCVGEYRETRPCPVVPCPTIAPTWNDWGSYGTCTTTCGAGQKTRFRTCPVVNQCPGAASETVPCSENLPCVTLPPLPTWGGWGLYDACTTTCGPGEKRRFRFCLVPNQCIGKAVESVPCSENPTCPTVPPAPTWSTWAPYTACPTTCGPAQKLRFRSCPVQNQCPGVSFESASCENDPCPAPTWSTWAPYTPCPTTCGPAQKLRFRSCPVQNQCPGVSFESASCENDPCPVITWGAWGVYSSCTRTCGSGTKTRMRICPASNQCQGDSMETASCGTEKCPPVTEIQFGRWGSYGEWSACKRRENGIGCLQSRNRPCLDGLVCRGLSSETRSCSTGPCGSTPTRPNQVACDASMPDKRRDCGYPGISREDCWNLGCCYSDAMIGQIWCFFEDFSGSSAKKESSIDGGSNEQSPENSEKAEMKEA